MTAHPRKPMTTLLAIEEADLASLLARLERIEKKLDAVDMQPRQEWMTVKAMAEQLNRSPRTVTRMIDAGKVESKTVGSVRMVRAR